MKTKRLNRYKTYVLLALLLILPIFGYVQAQEKQPDVSMALQGLLDE